MIEIPGKIPLRIHPYFWFLASLIGWLNTESFGLTLLWILIITISVIVHEFGHALASLSFGQQSQIDLVGFGGLTTHKGDKVLRWWQDFLIVLAGPVAGFILAFVAFAAFSIVEGRFSPHIDYALRITALVNTIWSIFNLFPVIPLDGGQLLRIILEALFGIRGLRIALWVGMIVGGSAVIYAFINQQIFMGMMFLLLSFESYRSWRYSLNMSDVDRTGESKEAFLEAQRLFDNGNLDAAFECFQKIRLKYVKGMMFTLSCVYCSKILADRGQPLEAYKALLPIWKTLPPESIVFAHRLAFKNEDAPGVIQIADACFRLEHSCETALINALCYAKEGKVRETIGWLESAEREGINVRLAALDHPFLKTLREDPQFSQWLQRYNP